ncbi:myb-like protein AA [Musca vetustissima]|uniref:myb-like protein AA n=1 Tax=Musca vetustissima TaxID=27455 RepID=UPI002AB5DF4E|nr:myb-like protein AA [Musca vetustissima]
MAAKPPKPPGNFLKNPQNSKSLNNNNNSTNCVETNNNGDNSPSTVYDNTTQSTPQSPTSNSNSATSTPHTKKSACNCTNITIMHLFHEMKQEFPTIPDNIVTQCVNENCHQRDECIRMLRNELELNPIPVQAYPAKVLHPPNTNSPIVQQKPPLKPPLKPVRPAPTHPTLNKINSPQLQRKIPPSSVNNNNNSPVRRHLLNKQQQQQITISGEENVASVGTPGGGASSAPLDVLLQKREPEYQTYNSEKNGGCTENNRAIGIGETPTPQPRARPTTLNLNNQQQQQQQQRQRLNVQLQEHFLQQRHKQQQQQPQPAAALNNATTTKPVRKAPLPPIAPKPSTLSASTTPQQHHHANHITSHSSNHHHNNNANNSGDSLSTHPTTASNSPLSESEISVNVSISTPPSPTSSTTSKTHHHQQQNSPQNKSPIRHRSVITLQPEPPYTRDFFQQTTNFATTPGGTTAPLTPTSYTSSSVVSSPTNSVGTSQKSYTSVNLTLRPPTTVLNSALQPSAIDITAGPGFSGASGGGKHLSYSSTSYDARLGYQQNFHITVTDEGGVFSASRRRPQRMAGQQQQVNICENQYDGNSDGDDNRVNSLYAEQQQQIQQQQQKQYLQQQQQQQRRNNPNNNLKSPQGIGSGEFGNMCLAPQQAEDEIVAEVLERQKKRRDKLAAALRENKKRLGQVEQEVNLITGTIPDGLAERLDTEIQRLRSECQAMLRSSKSCSIFSPTSPGNPMANQYPQQQQQTPQPFPRQRNDRPPPRPPPPRQTSLDIIQHHSTATPTSPHTPASLPNFNGHNATMSSPLLGTGYTQHQQQQFQHSHSLSPSIYSQQQQSPQSYHPPSPSHLNGVGLNDDVHHYYSDTDNGGDYDDDDDDDEELIEHWECNMCTFRNHPQLNMCECCDNVRILPGTLQNLSRAISTNSACSDASSLAVTNRSMTNVNALRSASGNSLNSNMGTNTAATTNAGAATVAASASATNGNLEHDTNLAQQQLQHFALHT